MLKHFFSVANRCFTFDLVLMCHEHFTLGYNTQHTPLHLLARIGNYKIPAGYATAWSWRV